MAVRGVSDWKMKAFTLTVHKDTALGCKSRRYGHRRQIDMHAHARAQTHSHTHTLAVI